MGKGDGALGHGLDVEGALEVGQALDEGLREAGVAIGPLEARQVLQLVRFEAQPLQVAQRVLETGRHGVGAAEGRAPEEEVEDRPPVGDARFPIAVGHRQLVEVGEEGEVGHVAPILPRSVPRHSVI